MCGICGDVRRPCGGLPDERTLRAMCGAQAHRGPDGEGVWCEGQWGLGHRRLTIIDLSDRGAQPMVDVDRRVAITFNGEIYNYVELRDELITRPPLHQHERYGGAATRVPRMGHRDGGPP